MSRISTCLGNICYRLQIKSEIGLTELVQVVRAISREVVRSHQNRIVGLLSHGRFSPGVEGRKVPSQNSDHPLLRVFAVGDVQEDVRVSEEVGVHLEQRPAFQNEGGQNDFRQIHSYAYLRQQVSDDRPVALHVHVLLVTVVALV